MTERKRLLDAALAAVRDAGAAIMAVYVQGNFETARKADASPITRADRDADRILIASLAKTLIPLVTEESCPPFSERKAWRRLWLIDPLDGTKDFLARNDEFTVNVALVEDGRPTVGVVHAPALGATYWAIRGEGAVRDGRPIRNDGRRTRLIAAESRFHHSPAVDEFCREHAIVERRRFGSALKLCKLAEGEVDVYPRLAGTMEWDTAAGHLIALEGGCRLDPELAYNKPDLLNPWFVAKGPAFKA